MASARIGFIGFGEMASIFSKAMCEKDAGIIVYNLLISQKEGLERIQKRIQAN
jgi:pyrroline-5-carboxylate reductase